jgi:hypothetical protein
VAAERNESIFDTEINGLSIHADYSPFQQRESLHRGMIAMSTPRSGAVRLGLMEDKGRPVSYESWITGLVQLGARAFQHSNSLENAQLILAISVPTRNYAAALIGCGWMLQTPAPAPTPILEILGDLAYMSPVRIITMQEVISDFFVAVDGSRSPPRVRLSLSTWQIDKIEAISVLSQLDAPLRSAKPIPHGVSELFRMESTWSSRLSQPPQNLMIVGSVSRIRNEISTYLSADSSNFDSERLSNILLMESVGVATWSTRLMTTAHFMQNPLVPSGVQMVVLDGSSPIGFIANISAPVVVAIVDRSVADETSSELLLQLRGSRGCSVSSENELKWTPPSGVEIMAFTVPL